jgi:HEXXH motif-containing protein
MMTSSSGADALLRELNVCGSEIRPADAPHAFAFALDFEPGYVWPDLAYDTSSALAHYSVPARDEMRNTVGEAAQLASARAPKAHAFINAHMKTALVCRSDALAGASSASNRELVGACVLTNMHAPKERVLVCVEALVHESIHQFLYKAERDHGNFCDLSEARTYRSFWTGSRIPLHSLIHACFVWYGLLTLWCQLARSADGGGESSFLRDKASRVIFGFAFARRAFADPAFPRSCVEPEILAAIDRIARLMPILGQAEMATLTLRESLRQWERGDWVARLAESLRCVDAMGPK